MSLAFAQFKLFPTLLIFMFTTQQIRYFLAPLIFIFATFLIRLFPKSCIVKISTLLIRFSLLFLIGQPMNVSTVTLFASAMTRSYRIS